MNETDRRRIALRLTDVLLESGYLDSLGPNLDCLEAAFFERELYNRLEGLKLTSDPLEEELVPKGKQGGFDPLKMVSTSNMISEERRTEVVSWVLGLIEEVCHGKRSEAASDGTLPLRASDTRARSPRVLRREHVRPVLVAAERRPRNPYRPRFLVRRKSARPMGPEQPINHHEMRLKSGHTQPNETKTLLDEGIEPTLALWPPNEDTTWHKWVYGGQKRPAYRPSPTREDRERRMMARWRYYEKHGELPPVGSPRYHSGSNAENA